MGISQRAQWILTRWARIGTRRAATAALLLGMTILVYTGSFSTAVAWLALGIVGPAIFLLHLLEQLAASAGEPGFRLGRVARAFLTVLGLLSPIAMVLAARDGEWIGAIVTAAVAPVMLIVGIRGIAYRQLGRAAS